MHMSDALVSPPVFAAAGAAAIALLAVSIHRIKRDKGPHTAAGHSREHIIPLMGVMGAFVFAAQMINFSIPGTGSSGHLVGGILLAAILGPWAGFLTLSSVLVVQCLLFADGGFMALGCNILNMAALSCLVAYPLVFRPLFGQGSSAGRTVIASMLACIAALELGALAVTLETEASGITALPTGRFLLFMLPIHAFIGIGEGLATAAVLYVVQQYKPELLVATRRPATSLHIGRSLAVIAAAALLVGASFSWVASSDPDGLEWSILRTSGQEELETTDTDGIRALSAGIQESTALMPDYNTTLAGLAGSGAIILGAFCLAYVLRTAQRRNDEKQASDRT